MVPPPETDQVTEVFELPVTAALNCCVAPVDTEAVLGVTATEIGVTAVAVPLKPIVAVLPVELLLVMVTAPEAVPAVVGAYFTVKVRDWPGVRVMGIVPGDILKPVPPTVAALITSDWLPADVKVTVCELVVLTGMLPKAKLPALALRVAAAAALPVICR